VGGEPEPREAPVLRVDSSKARERLGWQPAWDLAAGLDAAREWYAATDARQVTLQQIVRFEEASRAPVPCRR
jgi:CDP-glucose 4,6-dehydratase